jgi:hypothetical protein
MGPIQVFEHRVTIGRVDHRIAQRRGEPIQDPCLHEERLDILWLAGEDCVGQRTSPPSRITYAISPRATAYGQSWTVLVVG